MNNASIHLARDLGISRVIQLARKLGIESELESNLSLVLGSSSVTLLEMTRAYSIFPANGRPVVPRMIRRVLDAKGEVILSNVPLGSANPYQLSELKDVQHVNNTQEPEFSDVWIDGRWSGELNSGPHIISSEQAYLVTDLLRAVVDDAHGTGRRAASIGQPVAGKTGTTNDGGDAWFIGVHTPVGHRCLGRARRQPLAWAWRIRWKNSTADLG